MSTRPNSDPQAFTVLIVDDTSATLSLLAKHLEDHGLQVAVAEEGEEAIARARHLRPDLVLLDVIMPGIDGFETCRRLKASEETRDIPVIFMTALNDTQSKVTAFEVGGVDFVSKPIQLEEVLARVQTHLSLHALQCELERQVEARTEDLAQANRMLQILSDCNQVVVRATRESELLHEICRIIVDLGGYPLTWVGFIQNDEFRTLQPVAHRGSGGGYLESVHATTETGNAESPPNRAIQSGQPCIIQEFQSDQNHAAWKEEAIRQGFGSCIALPLHCEEGIFGSLSIYANETDAFHPQEVELLTELAGDLAYGIRTLRERDAHARSEENLRQLKEFNEGIVQNMAEGLIVLDDQERIRFVNPAIATLLGYGREELLNQPWATLVASDPSAKTDGSDAAYNHPTEGRIELKLVRKDRSHVSALVSISLRIPGDKSRGHLIAITDMSERKALENQLLQAQKMEAIGRLAGGVAHDFNNLLTAILGFCEILERSLPLADRKRQDLGEIRKAAERAGALTRQLLAFGRRQLLQQRVMNLNTTIENFEKLMRHLIREDMDLQISLATSLPNIHADAGQMEQVLLNLIVNSRDAMPSGGKLFIETRAVIIDSTQVRGHAGLAPGMYAMLKVTDTGIGIDKDTLPHIFEPFFTTKTEGRGTGLGLSTVYGIIKQSEGHIEVDSVPSLGTTFRIYLPVAPGEQAIHAQKLESSTAAAGSETILLVEDENMVRDIACRILRQNGYKVLEAGNGAEALACIDQHPDRIHLLLSDVVLPGGVNGWDLSQKLPVLRPGIKVLLMSGYVNDVVLQNAQMKHNLQLLHKPFTIAELTRKVREVLDASPTG